MNGLVPADRPTVTICIPVERADSRLFDLIGSLERQTHPNIAVVVSVDDEPERALPELPRVHENEVTVIQQPQRIGWMANVNELLKSVTTPYFVVVDQDDRLSPSYVAAAVDVLERRPEVAVVHGAVRYTGVTDGAVCAAESNVGARLERIAAYLEREERARGLATHGVVRSSLIGAGLHLRAPGADGKFCPELFEVETLIHGESVVLPENFYEELRVDQAPGHEHGAPSERRRSEFFADDLACLTDLLVGYRLPEPARAEILRAYTQPRADAPRDRVEQPIWRVGSRPHPPAPVPDGARKRVKHALRVVSVRLPHALRRNPLFDETWYVEHNPDVAAKGDDPYRHFWRHGIHEGRDPNPFFDTDWYVSQYADVRASGMDPLDHYLAFGAREGRDPGPSFETDWYLKRYPDVAASGLNPLEHYLRYGRAERRQAIDPDAKNQR